ncbi:MAG TPA: hypothetical protein VMV10_32725 [Pirellulales bacterium]|nr:hypothetical protein [Pirellulales bacterium]
MRTQRDSLRGNYGFLFSVSLFSWKKCRRRASWSSARHHVLPNAEEPASSGESVDRFSSPGIGAVRFSRNSRAMNVRYEHADHARESEPYSLPGNALKNARIHPLGGGEFPADSPERRKTGTEKRNP